MAPPVPPDIGRAPVLATPSGTVGIGYEAEAPAMLRSRWDPRER